MGNRREERLDRMAEDFVSGRAQGGSVFSERLPFGFFPIPFKLKRIELGVSSASIAPVGRVEKGVFFGFRGKRGVYQAEWRWPVKAKGKLKRDLQNSHPAPPSLQKQKVQEMF